MTHATAITAISMMPVLTGSDLLGGRLTRQPSIRDVGKPILTTLGKTAIFMALRQAGVGAGSEVLVPAFHCPSMVTPIVACGAKPLFYEIHETLELDVSSIESLLSPKVRAVIAPHLFGRIQHLAKLKLLCESVNAVLVEDCAHSFFGDVNGLPVGSIGHYAIASPRKFFPLCEGGLLTSADQRMTSLRVIPSSLTRQLTVAFDTVDLAVRCGRLRMVQPILSVVRAAHRAVSRRKSSHGDASGELEQLDPLDAPLVVPGAAAVTSALLTLTATEKAMQKRTVNFQFLCQALKDVTGVTVLNTSSVGIEGAVPYMVPILLSKPEEQFARLKSLGFPMWRWESSRMGLCKVTDWYARALIHLPCHQSLRREELQAMVAVLESVVAS